MKRWAVTPPRRSEMGDHDVPSVGRHLEGKRIALLVSGGIAAIKAPFIARALRRQGADVVAYCSKEALRYTTEDALEWSTTNPVVTRLTPSSEHLSDEKRFAGYLLAPATYNSVNKMAQGVADNVLTATLAAALGRMERGETRVLVAPTMHGDMHTSILTQSLAALERMGVRIIPPRDDYGKHNIPDTPWLVAEVCAALSESTLKGCGFLVTGGPTPTIIDSVRRITNRFTGKLGAAIADELTLRGAEVRFILGTSGLVPPEYIETTNVGSFEEYRDAVMSALSASGYAAGIFSAAVADYRPTEHVKGKIPSGGTLKALHLEPTEKVIDRVRKDFPELPMVSFKYEENVSHGELMRIARLRCEKGHLAVVANRGEEKGPSGEQVAYIVSNAEEPARFVGKPAIACGLADFLERSL
ncbi:MAG TPA: phosphopantothenoylcysteine decarboxylase [Vicinamibacteria bacterium]|nr:phosphopantothenoylcysteine decarboxylase [Vicinamibacteria bacterium]